MNDDIFYADVHWQGDGLQTAVRVHLRMLQRKPTKQLQFILDVAKKQVAKVNTSTLLLQKRLLTMFFLVGAKQKLKLESPTPLLVTSANTLLKLPSVTVVVPTCFHRRNWHPALYRMLQHQDYLGKLEFLIMDGACETKNECNSHKAGIPSPLLREKMSTDKRPDTPDLSSHTHVLLDVNTTVQFAGLKNCIRAWKHNVL